MAGRAPEAAGGANCAGELPQGRRVSVAWWASGDLVTWVLATVSSHQPPVFTWGSTLPESQLRGLDGASPQLQDGTLGSGLWQVVPFPPWVTLVGAEVDTHGKTVSQRKGTDSFISN